MQWCPSPSHIFFCENSLFCPWQSEYVADSWNSSSHLKEVSSCQIEWRDTALVICWISNLGAKLHIFYFHFSFSVNPLLVHVERNYTCLVCFGWYNNFLTTVNLTCLLKTWPVVLRRTLSYLLQQWTPFDVKSVWLYIIISVLPLSPTHPNSISALVTQFCFLYTERKMFYYALFPVRSSSLCLLGGMVIDFCR